MQPSLKWKGIQEMSKQIVCFVWFSHGAGVWAIRSRRRIGGGGRECEGETRLKMVVDKCVGLKKS